MTKTITMINYCFSQNMIQFEISIYIVDQSCKLCQMREILGIIGYIVFKIIASKIFVFTTAPIHIEIRSCDTFVTKHVLVACNQ